MKNDWRLWVAEAEEINLPVQEAENFQVYTVSDSAEQDNLLALGGWELWNAVQDYIEGQIQRGEYRA